MTAWCAWAAVAGPALGLATLAAWVHLLTGRHGYWRSDQVLGALRASAAVDVVAIVPARNEAPTVAQTVASLVGQDHEGRLTIIVVDDGSSDGTGAAAALVPVHDPRRRVIVVTAPPPPAGWSGKVAAQQSGLKAAAGEGLQAPWLWLTDADIVHAPDVLARLVGCAEQRRCRLVSVMVDLRVEAAIERWLVPVFVHFFQLLYPFRAVNDKHRATAAAAGGCILVERAAFDDAGGFGAIRSELIDDIALARAIKRRGHAIWLGLDHGSRSLRAYDFATFWAMVRRTAFTELDCSYVRLAGAVAGLALLFVVPWALVVVGGTGRIPALAAVALMSWSLVPTLRWYSLSPARALLFAPAAWAYMAMTLTSAWRYARGRRAVWHGRDYSS